MQIEHDEGILRAREGKLKAERRSGIDGHAHGRDCRGPASPLRRRGTPLPPTPEVQMPSVGEAVAEGATRSATR